MMGLSAMASVWTSVTLVAATCIQTASRLARELSCLELAAGAFQQTVRCVVRSSLAGCALALAGPLVGRQQSLAHAEVGRRDLDQLVGLDEVQCLFERQPQRRRQLDGDLRGRGADV